MNIRESASPPGQTTLTDSLVARLDAICWDDLPAAARHSAKRHLVDTVGAIAAGSRETTTRLAEAAIAAVRTGGSVPLAGTDRRFDMLDAAYIAAVAGHGLELDDGYRAGSAHPGVTVVPAALAVGWDRHSSGIDLLTAVVAGYEAMTTIARVAHPMLRKQGFHPTAACGVFGAAAAAAKLRGASPAILRTALGLAASSAGGLFAFVDGGADVKRLHPGHAAREGLFALLLAEQGVNSPKDAIAGRNGFLQAFAQGGHAGAAELPASLGIEDCYVKPYPCCRHLHPAVDALLAILAENDLPPERIERIEVETYNLAAEHAHIGWSDFASSQLSFKFVMATALRHRSVLLGHFSDTARADRATTDLCERIEVRGTAEMDKRYKTMRPASVTVTSGDKRYVRDVDDALGAPSMPVDDSQLREKFADLAGTVIGHAKAEAWFDMWWQVDSCSDVRELMTLDS